MSASREEPLQLPSWDEFEPAEQLDYEEDEEATVEDQQPEEAIEEPSSSRSPLPATGSPPPTSSSAAAAAASLQLPPLSARVPPHNAAVIGPSLPPGLVLHDDDEDEEESEDPEDPVDDPVDPDDPGMGGPSEGGGLPTVPCLPLSTQSAALRPLPASRMMASYGMGASAASSSSSLPPPEPSSSTGRSRVIGPAIPPDLLPFEANGDHAEEEEEVAEEEEEEEEVFGPAPPPGLAPQAAAVEMEMPVGDEEDEGGDIIGPLPPGHPGARQDEMEYAARRAALEAAKAAEASAVKRDEWMVELPKQLNKYGLGARQFSRAGQGPAEADASWMETPEQKKKRREKEGEAGPSGSGSSGSSIADKERDKKQQAIADSLNKGRTDSLLDMHNKKRKTDAASSSTSESNGGDRRAFDREKDMAVRGLRPTSSAEVKERCGQLGSRFGNSTSQKFL